MKAYCYANGCIHLGEKVPSGALLIASGPKIALKNTIDVLARWSYPSKPGANDSYPLVPGIPEAPNQSVAIEALYKFSNQIREHLKSA